MSVMPRPPAEDSTAEAVRSEFELKIKQGETDVTDKTQSAIVGQQINLTCVLEGGGAPPEITSYQWSVPGYAVAGYNPSVNSATVNSNVVTTNSSVTFYWVDGGTKVVNCRVTAGGQELSAKTTFDVMRPTSSLTAVTTTNQPAVNVIPVASLDPTRDDPPYYLAFGAECGQGGVRLTNSTGIGFSGQVTAPSNGFGAIGFIQLIPSTLRSFTKNDGTKWKLSSHGMTYLDSSPFIVQSGVRLIYDGSTQTTGDSDTPADPLYCDYRVDRVNDQFRTYLMYQPAGGLWVPLKVISWNWTGAATNGGSPGCAWSMLSGSAAADPTGADTIEFPQWDGHLFSLLNGGPEPDE